MKRLSRLGVASLALAASTMIGFQNCSKVNFADSRFDLASLSSSSLSSVTVSTKKNMPVTFNAGTISGQSLNAVTLSFSTTPGQNSFSSSTGTYKITDPNNFTIVYTPNESFVGVDTAVVYATDAFGHNIPGQVSVVVGNLFNALQPSLAARGMSCTTCHSSIASNIMTDYGYGNSWYFDTTSTDSFYFDRLGTPGKDAEGLATITLKNNSKFIVPKAPVPSAIATKFNVQSLAGFVQARFAQALPTQINSATQVLEISSLKINVPTAARIKQLFSNPSANQVYMPDTQNSPALSGVTFDSANNLFVIQNAQCDGDLYLGADVFFNSANIQSINGCRIYTTGTVFMDVPVVSSAYKGSSNYNTQIMSAQSVWIGTGRLYNSAGAYCDPNGWYTPALHCDQNVSTNISSCNSNPNTCSCDTLNYREAVMLQRNTFATAYPNLSAIQSVFTPKTGAVDQVRAKVEAHLGHPLYDASCSAGGRATTISRLMLVAPYVNNRFNGEFSGSVIAEAPLMSLGTFTYQFDPVFTQVSIFSLLSEGELLSGQGI